MDLVQPAGQWVEPYLNWSPGWTNYDGNGALTQEGGISATYNALNQPVSIWSATTGQTVWFAYDPLGRCVKRWTGPSDSEWSNPATYLYYDGWNLVQEGPSAGNAEWIYFHGGRVDEMLAAHHLWSNGWNYYHYDARGHTIGLTDWWGNLVEQYDYHAFGSVFTYDGAGNWVGAGATQRGNRFLFTGREWLKDLGIYDYRHRMYHPELGRFLQPDPKHFEAGDYNLYRYCHNDPINKTDPTGLADNIFVQIADGMAYIGRGIIDAFSTLGNQAVADVGENPGQYAIAATMGRGPKMQGPSAPLRGLGNPFKGKTPAEAAKMMERKGFERRGPDPEKGKGGYVNPKNDRSYHIDPKNRHNEPPHVDVNRPKDYNGPLEKKKLPLKEN